MTSEKNFERQQQKNLHQNLSLASYLFVKDLSKSFFVTPLFRDNVDRVSITSFQLCNIASEPQKLQSVCCFLKLNNTLEYFESNRILFSVLKIS